jgi:RNA methyltransferase, TrmH family
MSTGRRTDPRVFRKLESRQNARVKELRAALGSGIVPKRPWIAVEGEHLLAEAVRSGLRVHSVFLREGCERLFGDGIPDVEEVFVLPPEVFASAAATEHPQGIAAFVEMPWFAAPQEGALAPGESAWGRMSAGIPLILVAGGLQDPGNVGTIARSAEAFGASGMILLPGTASLWNPKTLRASAGAAFRLPSLRMAAEDAFTALRAKGIRIFAATPRHGTASLDFSQPAALLIGNEGAGLPASWLERADEQITIPTSSETESLNAAVAGSLLLYEAFRQRRPR